MINLSTNYVGLKLKNPIIVSSSGLTNTAEKIKKIEDCGAGAVVLKSLFEEQIRYETSKLLSYNDYPEAEAYITNYAKNNSISEYLKVIEDTKKIVKIPVFASINCATTDEWINFAKQIESSGADGLELNIHILTLDKAMDSNTLEQKYFSIVSAVRKLIKIPIVVKIGYNFSNILYFTEQLYANGANAVVLFNRFYEPDIDIENFKLTSADVFSTHLDIRNALRWIAILSSKTKNIEISASTGVHEGKSALKMLLAGANTVQICSTLYRNGIEHISSILEFMTEYIYRKGFESVDAIRGKMSYINVKDSAVYERSQFMKYFSSME